MLPPKEEKLTEEVKLGSRRKKSGKVNEAGLVVHRSPDFGWPPPM